MFGRMRGIAALVVCTVLWQTAEVRAGYDIQVDLKNVSGQVKTDWPVVLRVYTVFGRNLSPSRIRPDGYHVYDPAGKEVPHDIEVIPPADQPGNDEIVFVIPRIEAGQALRYRISNSEEKSTMRRPIDVVGSSHNLVHEGGFERASEDGSPEGFEQPALRSTGTKHSGEGALMLAADGRTASTRYERTVPLHKGSWYYFGAWSKTDNVSRFGYEAGEAAHFRIAYAQAATTGPSTQAARRKPPVLLGAVTPQCSTRDWLKVTFESDYTDWGVERYVAQASDTQATMEFILEQRKHYYMEPGKTRGTWWLDDVVLMEQPEVNVRFDLALQPEMKDGIFLFTRTPGMPLGKLQELGEDRKPMWPHKTDWCAMPFAHERLEKLDAFAVHGQRVSFCVGLYHTRPLKDVVVRLADEGLGKGEGEHRRFVRLESVEYCPGYLGEEPSRYMKMLYASGRLFDDRGMDKEVEAVTPGGETGVRYWFLTFHVDPTLTEPGRYSGTVEVLIDGKVHRRIPIALRLQDLAQPHLPDTYVGLIYNGGLPDVDDMLKQYSRSGFSCITWFHRWLPFAKGEDGKMHVDVPALDKKMQQLMKLGIVEAVSLYSDIQVDDKPKGHRGVMFGHAGGDKGEYLRMLGELQAGVKAHPEWPRIVYMNWDEPNMNEAADLRERMRLVKDPAAETIPAGEILERMGWTSEVIPDAITTLDVQFARLPRFLKYYNTPAFDDPANWAGPEVYRYVRQQGKQFGMCGATDTAEANRYQAGMFMIASGATYFHAWHIRGGHTPGQMDWDPQKKITMRGTEMLCWASGMDDLKAYRLLKNTIEDAKKSGSHAKEVEAAERYLASVLAVFTGDHKDRWSLQPYLGTAWSWGYEGFYDDWQEQMLRHAAAIKGTGWVE